MTNTAMYEKVKQALLTIQHLCENSDCECCLLRTETDDCYIQKYPPPDWEFIDPLYPRIFQ